MKIFSALLSIVLLVYGCLMLIPPKPVKNVSFYGDTDGLVIAHRAGRGLMPGNTLAAAKNAISLGGRLLQKAIRSFKTCKVTEENFKTADSRLLEEVARRDQLSKRNNNADVDVENGSKGVALYQAAQKKL